MSYLVIYPSGTKRWFHNDQNSNECNSFYYHAKYHDNLESWWIQSTDGSHQRHRLDGPALIFPDGSKQWRYKGKHINVNSQQEFERYIRLLVFL